MKIVDTIQDSFQEYEGYHSLVLFCHGCNLACRGCYNYDAITSGQSIGDAEAVIEAQITPLHEAVVFLGGEPTLWHQSLLEAAKMAQTMNLKVKVFTNGLFPTAVESLLNERVVNFFSVDLKCIENASEVLGVDITDTYYLTTVAKTVNLIRNARVGVELRTTVFDHIGDVDAIKAYASKRFFGVEHIFQPEFQINA